MNYVAIIEQTIASNAYRVIARDTENGGILLAMSVCQACSEKAQELGLKNLRNRCKRPLSKKGVFNLAKKNEPVGDCSLARRIETWQCIASLPCALHGVVFIQWEIQ